MKKKDLERIENLQATEEIIELARQSSTETGYNNLKLHNTYRYRCLARVLFDGEILKVAVFDAEDIRKGDTDPRYEIFIGLKEEKYLSRKRRYDGPLEWRTAMLENLLKWYWYDYDEYCWMLPEEKEQLETLLNAEKRNGIFAIQEWQDRIREKIAIKKYKQITEIWDAAMKPVRKPPHGFYEWSKKNGFDGENYIFYDYEKQVKEGFCTACQRIVPIDADQKPRHGSEGWCSSCNKEITYIARKKRKEPMRTSFRGVRLIQNYGTGVITRCFSLRRIDNPRVLGDTLYHIEESRRIIAVGGKAECYDWNDYKERGYRWTLNTRFEDSDYGRYYKIYEYPDNVQNVLNKLHSAYSIYTIANAKKAVSVTTGYFLYMEQKYPVIEKVFKAGLINLGRDYITTLRASLIPDCTVGGELAKLLQIDGARMKRLKAADGNSHMLAWLQEEKRRNTQFPDDAIKLLSIAGMDPDDDDLNRILKYLSLKKTCNYVRKQLSLLYPDDEWTIKRNIKKVMSDWVDYLRMMEQQKMDMSKELLLKPKNIVIAHNELVAQIDLQHSGKKIKEIQSKFPDVDKVCEELRKYEYADEQYCIVAPKGVEDIFREGLTLKHCIHTCDIYFNRIEKRETYLMFLRRVSAPETPWYTLEVEPGGNIRQKKSVLNEAYKDLEEAVPFLKKWQQYVQEHMSKEDKKLAKMSDEARKTGYKQLRDEKKIIWHGKLQGKLLADALESDFMAAN